MSVFSRIRRNGLAWAMRRAMREVFVPETKMGKALRPITAPVARLARLLISLRRRKGLSGRIYGHDTLLFFYDLEVSPITFDFGVYLAQADMRRRELGLARIHVCFVPGVADGLAVVEADYDAVVGPDSRRWRLRNICIPLTYLLPACSGYTLCGSRAEAAALLPTRREVYLPDGYDPAAPSTPTQIELMDYARRGWDPKSLRVPAQGRTYLRQWMDTHVRGRKLVTITLRDYNYLPARNSNKAAWSAFARQLDPTEFCVVIIPDTDRAMESDSPEFSGLNHFREACWNVVLRAAIYESAWLNLAASGGQSGIWWVIPTIRYILFKLIVPGVAVASVELVEARGFTVGETPPFAGPYQKWVWEADDLPIIEREFAAMAQRLRDDGY